MRQVVRDVYVMEGLRRANVYLLRSGKGFALVDSGWAGDLGRILAQFQEAGYALSELHSIVITHWHGDHTGNAAELAQRSGAQIVAHRDEVPYLERTKPLPRGSPAKRLLNWLGDRTLLRRSPCKVDCQVQDGDLIEALGRMQVIHTPGHTPGSICLYHPERRILFCGDALFNMHPITGRPGLGLHMRLVTLDNAQARDSVARLSALPIQVLCCGHGEVILDGAGERMRALLGPALHLDARQ